MYKLCMYFSTQYMQQKYVKMTKLFKKAIYYTGWCNTISRTLLQFQLTIYCASLQTAHMFSTLFSSILPILPGNV